MLGTANTSFHLPEPNDAGPYFVKEFHFRVEALDATGGVLNWDSTGMIGEPPWAFNSPWEPAPCPEDISSAAGRTR
ncbi:MAG: hypothetical protein HY723_06765 [Chloroflexi bacterium]|nr:hypothetical protein [Chloroflexota bacterium]